MSKALCQLLTLLICAASAGSSSGSNYVYVVDTSDSMKWHRPLVIDAVIRDLEKALQSEPPIYKAGDRIYLWSFSATINEKLKIDFVPNSENKIRVQIQAQLNRLKWGGLTTLARPLLRAMEEFRPSDVGTLNLFVYTDGRDPISARYFDTILRIYNHSFRPEARLSNFFVLQFGKEVIPESTRRLAAEMGGKILSSNHSPELQPVAAAEPRKETVISITPGIIQLSAEAAPEIVRPVPVEFKVDPPQTGLSIGVSLETTNLPSGMVVSTTADRLATEGRQSIGFSIRNGRPGLYSARLKLISSARIEPGEIPVQIEIKAMPPAAIPKPNTIGVQFHPEPIPLIDLAAGSAWQEIPNVRLALFYAETMREKSVRFVVETPPGVEFAIVREGESAKTVAIGSAVNLGELGRAVAFRLRQVAADAADKSLAANLTFQVEPGQNVNLEGSGKITIPFRFVSPSPVAVDVRVQVESREISFGPVGRGGNSARATLGLQVHGDPEGRKLLLTKSGSGLEGISITPAEIPLKAGALSVDLQFSGLENRPPGHIEGTLLLTSAEGSLPFTVQDGSVPLRGRIAEPARILVELENPMVAGRPLFIRARFDSGEKGAFHATIRPPDGHRELEVQLVDDGSAEAGDVKANDAAYSGAFKKADDLGKYQITVSATGNTNGAKSVSVPAAYYFKAANLPLTGKLTKRGLGEFIEFKCKVVSEFFGGLTIQAESAIPEVPLSTYFSTATLQPGENVFNVLVRLTPATQPGSYKYQLHLMTAPIDGQRARIPLSFEVSVVSPFHYFVRLTALTLTLGLIVYVAIAAPWRKSALSKTSRRTA